jgi:hypothetical protein
MNTKTAWLIERNESPPGPAYLAIADSGPLRFIWTSDPNAALQYPSKQEAEDAWGRATRGKGPPAGDAMSSERIRITEHEWPEVSP